MIVFSPLYLLLAKAYVYPMLRFDFTGIFLRETRIQLLVTAFSMISLSDLILWRYNKEKFKKKKPQGAEVSVVI